MNPALGVRGLRTARVRPDVLDRQLKATARAARSSAAEVWVMAPMVSTISEAEQFVSLAHQAGLPRAGVMVEVPALALRAREVAKVVDFFSIGTNDLCQYVTASDRTIGALSDLLDHWQPAAVALIREVVDGANEVSIPVGVCGESASDPLFALVLVGLGVTSLSMSAAGLPLVRASLAAHSLQECRQMAEIALNSKDPEVSRRTVAESSRIPMR
jgi:phosphotransferase system enzyme I (PtsI)